MSEYIYKKYSNSGYGAVKEVLFGIECEIEDIKAWNEWVGDHWGITEDGSLRNNGKEFLMPPNNFNNSMEMFKKLHANLSLGKEPFSDRTSIHVHVNMQNLRENEVKQIILLYALFEEYFFMIPDSGRRANIHCVPLSETFLPSYYNQGLPVLHQKWQKYSALNVKPLTEHGTLEFRHMHGHNDADKMAQWLKLLENLVQVGSTMEPFSPTNLTPENIRALFSKLFGHFPQHDSWKMTLSESTFNSVLDIKLSF